MSDHKYYESMIFEYDDLNQEQKLSLHEHLSTCSSCEKLFNAWVEVRQQLQAAPMVKPSPGFTNRFRNRMAEKKALQQIEQVKKFFLILGSITFTILGLFIFTFWQLDSPVAFINSIIAQITQTVIWFGQVQSTLINYLSSISPIFSTMVWIMFMSFLAGLTLIWLTSIWRFSLKGGFNK